MKEPKTLRSLFSHPGFKAEARLYGVAGDRYARLIKLRRSKKREFARSAERGVAVAMTRRYAGPGTYRSVDGGFMLSLSDGGSIVRGVEPCA
jgi:hypothetical protein